MRFYQSISFIYTYYLFLQYFVVKPTYELIFVWQYVYI